MKEKNGKSYIQTKWESKGDQKKCNKKRNDRNPFNFPFYAISTNV